MVSLKSLRGFLTAWRLSTKRRTSSTALSDRNYMKLYQNILSNYIKQYETIYETNRHIDLLIQQIRLMPSNAAKKNILPFLFPLSGGTWFWINFLYSAVVVAPERIDPKKMDLLSGFPSWEARHIDQMHFMYFILGLFTFWELSYLL